MTAANYIDETRAMARRLEERFAPRFGCMRRAREAIARTIGGGFVPGTLETLRKGRLKRIDGWASERLREVLIADIKREVEELEHDLAIYSRTSVSSIGSEDIAEAEALLARARATLARTNGGAPDGS